MSTVKPRISLVGAARPNFVKVAPLLKAIEDDASVEFIHTGQHYDWEMSGGFFEDLDIGQPDKNLEIGSGTHAEQTAGVLVAFETHLLESKPDAVVVVGDVNSTLACSLAASKLGIPVAHVEAGLRSRDWSMPEEVNRVLTDRLSCWLFTPSEDADLNLEAEGIAAERIHRVGNVMIDSLLSILPKARKEFDRLKAQLGMADRYAILTLHRPSNVDGDVLLRLTDCLMEIGGEIPILFPVHPRTAQRLERIGFPVDGPISAIDPLGYRDFVSLMERSTVVFTDSGGIQEETSILGVPCITLRETTERPITSELGTNQVVGSDPAAITAAMSKVKERKWEPAEIPLWDGMAATRVAEVLLNDLNQKRRASQC